MPSDDRQYGNSEKRKRNDENWQRRSRETDNEKIGNLTVRVHDISGISGTKLGKYDTRS